MSKNDWYQVVGRIGSQPFSRTILTASPKTALKKMFPHAVFKMVPQRYFGCDRWSRTECFNRDGHEIVHIYDRRQALRMYILMSGELCDNTLYDNVKQDENDAFVGRSHDTLSIVACMDNNYAHKGAVRNLYKCVCHLCGKTYYFTDAELQVRPPDEYGVHAYNGYWSEACCHCHEISSFQWTLIDILEKHLIRYYSEVGFNGLVGVGGGALRFDFMILDASRQMKCLVELQGEQHYNAVSEFGGVSAFRKQQANDAIKRKFCEDHRIPLFVIDRVSKKQYEHLESILSKYGII